MGGYVHAGSAVCIGLGSFQGDVSPDEEPPADALRDLPYARAVTKDLAEALAELGFSCSVYTEKDLPTAPELGSCVSASLASATSGAHVVHVLSHGHPGNAGVYVVGADGSWDTSTRVESWVASVEDHPSRQRPHTLFVVDTCYSGQAARLSWLPAATEQTRAWVIAASAPDAPAFNGRLTQAVTTVLRKLKSGELDFSPSTYVPFVHLVEHVRREVVLLGGTSQYVTGTPVDGWFEPPLFANPRPALPGSPRVALSEVDSLVGPFGDLDPALDPAHFLDRAAGHGEAALANPMGFFTGRPQQIEELTASLDHDRASGLTVVTGGAGSGKSALLGVLVCALHPHLRQPTRHLWRQVPVPGSAWTGPLAAVHLRERTLDEATSALVRQLHLPVSQQSTPREVVQAISALREVPLIVFDALDESAEQDAVHRQLLHPLAAAKRTGGGPAVHLWVGTRPWRQFDDLLGEAGARDHLINLDAVSVAQLRAELRDYVDDLLANAAPYQDRSVLRIRRALAQGVADVLTADSRDRGGEFLIAALYTHWLLRRGDVPCGADDVDAILEQIPVDVPAVLELDLSTRADQPWLTAILTTLGHAHGAGMPATVLRRTAGAFHLDAASPEISVPDFDRLLQQVRFYLRSTPDSDGTSLYRLFHQSLVEHLNDPDADLSTFVDRIMATVPAADGRLRVEAAEPYVQRHWVQHAADAGRLDLLVQEWPSDLVLPLNAAARTRQGRVGAAVYRQASHLTAFLGADSRRQLLCMDAYRYGARELGRRLAAEMTTPVPQWATGGATKPWMRAVMNGHKGSVHSVAVGQVEGRTFVVSGGFDTTVRIWDAATGSPMGAPLTGHTGPVTSVAVGQIDGNTIIASGSTDTTVRIWDAATGLSLGDPLTGHADSVTSVAVGQIEENTIIASGSKDMTVRIWDAGTGNLVRLLTRGPFLRGRPLGLRSNSVTAVAIGHDEGRTFIAAGSERGTVEIWDAGTGRFLNRHKPRYDGDKSAVISLMAGDTGDHPILVSASQFGTIRARHLASGSPLDNNISRFTLISQLKAAAVGQVAGRTVILLGSTHGVKILDFATSRNVGHSLSGIGTVTSVAVGEVQGHPIIVSGSPEGSIHVWDPPIGTPVGDATVGHSAPVSALAAGRMGERDVVVSGSTDASVRVWDAETGEPIGKPLTGHSAWINSVAVGRVGSRTIIVAGSDDYAIRTWDAENGTPLDKTLRGQTGLITAVAIDSDEDRPIIVAGSSDATIRIWDAHTCELIGGPLTGHRGRITSVALGKINGRTIIVSGSHDQTVRVWDASTGEPVGEPLTGHASWVTSVALANVGDRAIIISGSDDKTTRLWHATFHRRRLPDRRIEWERAITTVDSIGKDEGKELKAAVGFRDSISFWHDGPVPRLSQEWKFPYLVRHVCRLPSNGFAVAFGSEVAVFRLDAQPKE
jgi:WD40 repeat protein